jgi:DNA-binding MarR family transcriptional regulator
MVECESGRLLAHRSDSSITRPATVDNQALVVYAITMHDMDPFTDCFCLASRRLSRLLTQAYDGQLADAGIKITQFSLLVALDKAAQKEVPLKRIAENLDMDASTLTRNLNLLVRDGLAEFLPATDQREKRAQLTKAGRECLARAKPMWREAQKMVASKLEPRSVAHLKTMVDAARV